METSPSQDTTRDDLDIGSRDSFAFLNHSTSSLHQQLPPSVDDKPLARQKRKRTSPEDQAVLEAAYVRDPKPDKSARLELVRQVALGEKEVQIWFQNRRQTSRRKSRPLLPHEIAQYSFARSEALEHGLLPGHVSASPSAEIFPVLVTQPESDMLSSQILDDAPPQTREQIPVTERLGASPTALPTEGPLDAGSGTLAVTGTLPASPAIPPLYRDSHDLRASIGNEPRSLLKKSSSFVRLSMTADGNAQITTKDATSPSPPRPSQSSSTWSDNTPASSFSQKLSRSTSGRSRDSRSWEFWCDKEARSELESKAEKDTSGSATSAIGLLRSASGRSILGSVPSKRNAILSRSTSSSKRARLTATAPSLRRSSTSLGRLQSKPDRAHLPAQARLKSSRSATAIRIPGNESDKENWSPDRETSRPGKPFGKAGTDGGGVVKQLTPLSSHPTHRRKRGHHERPQGVRPGDLDPDDDAELAAFMHGEQRSSSPSVENDLNCVQGLLSLSQGNWR